MCARLFLSLLSLLALASAQAQTAIDSLPSRMAWATVRVRMRAPGLGSSAWTATIGDCASHLRVRVEMPQRDELYGRRCVASACRVRSGEEQQLGATEFNCFTDEASVRIVYDGYSARIYAGETANSLICRLDSLCPGPISVEGNAQLVEAWARCLPLPEPEMSRFASVDELLARLAYSQDKMEAVWTYLDRDIDPARASLNAHYTLATVRNGNAYDIIYLSAANPSPDNWQPMQIKGRLKPTIFIDHYDLDWRDSAGVEIGDEAHAQLSSDGSILTLSFPLLSAQLRFSRMPQSAIESSYLH